MILKLRLSLLIITLSTLFYSCQKEYSLEGAAVGGTAVFTFVGAPGACTNAVISGTYQVGTALDATNVVTIAVDVTTAGTYTASTALVNGISFTGSGSFSTTGIQTITLTGSGIPLAQGTFSFTPGTNGCSFPIIVASGGGGSGAVFTLNGAPGNCTSFVAGGTYTVGTPLVGTNTATVSVNVTTPGTYSITTNTVNGITFSATGTFTVTGTQLIQLTGSGTPLAAGSFTYTPGTNGCTFSITVISGGAGTSVFTYDGAPGSCTSATPAGTYTTGVPLTAANTVTVSVNVTTIGTYNISTPPVNGITFSGSGSFTATGSQHVVLTGAGIPTIAGVFNYVPTNNGCSFPVTTVAAVVTDYLRCTIDGVARTFNDDLLGERIAADTFDISGYETSAPTSPAFLIRLTKPTAIAPGVYNRYSTTAPTTTFSLALYSDGVSSTDWITALGIQTGQFSVTVQSYTTNRITGIFSGTLYNNNGVGTGTKLITNGEFSLPY